MSAIEDYSQHKATRDRWEIWFRKRLGNDDKRIQAAVDAAMRKALNGASSQDAALAGIAAAAAVLPDVTTSSTSGHHPPDIPPNLESMQSGTIVGHARNVRQQSQLSGGGSIITLDFRLESPNSPVIQVQMRGPLLSGAIKDGDVVEVQCADTRDGLVHTDYVYNRSTNSEVRMRKGFSGVAGTLEARWGGRQWKRLLIVIGAVAAIFVMIGVVIFIVAAVTVMQTGSDMRNNTPNPPAWICEQAKKMGSPSPPGC
jgi:hypothetical protein